MDFGHARAWAESSKRTTPAGIGTLALDVRVAGPAWIAGTSDCIASGTTSAVTSSDFVGPGGFRTTDSIITEDKAVLRRFPTSEPSWTIKHRDLLFFPSPTFRTSSVRVCPTLTDSLSDFFLLGC